jgi:hypothetical protein
MQYQSNRNLADPVVFTVGAGVARFVRWLVG